jgi:putative tricarboxylic transport membrane protein
MKFNDAISGLFLAVLAVAVIAYSRTLPAMPGQFVGPGLFPTLIGAGMLIGALLLIARGLGAGRPWVKGESWARDPRRLAHLLLIVALILAYILFSEFLGFVVIAAAMLAALFAIGGVRARVGLPVALVATLAVDYAFQRMLRVPLPRGLTGFLPF